MRFTNVVFVDRSPVANNQIIYWWIFSPKSTSGSDQIINWRRKVGLDRVSKLSVGSSVRMAVAKEQTSFCQSLSAEPAIFLYSFALYWYNVMIPNLIQQKVCRPEFPPPVGFACSDRVLLAKATGDNVIFFYRFFFLSIIL